MVSDEKAALSAINAVLVCARALAFERESEELAQILDAAEYLPALMLEPGDRTDAFRAQLLDLAGRFPSFARAVHAFDGLSARDTFVRHLDRAFEPLSNLTVPGAGRVLGRVRAEAGAVLCGDQGIAIEIGDERTGIPFDRLVVDWPPLLAWAELQRKGRGVLVLGTAEKKWALELDSLSFSGLVNALRVVGKDEPVG